MKKGMCVLLVFLLYFPSALGMCPMMAPPPQREIIPDDNTHGLLVFDAAKKKEHLILEPSFHGNAKDFGMVMPTPSKPELLEADEKLFQELEELTNPLRKDAVLFALPGRTESAEGIRVIEVKDVGDFTATTLTAEDALSLIKWLNENNYAFKPGDVENFEYYVKKGNYFFVVLKVNMKKAKVDEKGNLRGKLRPIEFVFTSEKPMLPIRIMRSDMEVMSFTLYTLSDAPYYVPGTKVLFSRKLTKDDFAAVPTLRKYAQEGNWLVRSTIKFDFMKISNDLFLEKGNNKVVVENPDSFKIINPHLLSGDTGILLDKGPVLYVEKSEVEKACVVNYVIEEKDDLKIFVYGIIVGVIMSLVIFFMSRKR